MKVWFPVPCVDIDWTSPFTFDNGWIVFAFKILKFWYEDIPVGRVPSVVTSNPITSPVVPHPWEVTVIVFVGSTVTFVKATVFWFDAFDVYEWMEALNGDWVLSPADKQTGTDSYKHKAVLPLVGTNATGISFKSIGRKSTVQEDLLPNTAKQMVTMYHCKGVECEQIKATHYCVKQNQPEFIANFSKSSKNRVIFDCDMSTEICQSDEDHVHQIDEQKSQNLSSLFLKILNQHQEL